ncbi:glycerate kinase [Dolichospermum sp. ST_con]|nr:glycerate kinase [Dolichospermum sp. ST_con]MDD1418457.1 glycerate kinase [Dolichospermum sp. ST_sed1]MDD1425985.1 glycerate kinase [Dolichospermum sp. ST_sed9]MDD1430171.1 glycerate kinase [Dolichospermum sp. ST_sed6]MDD1435299.1 glycerate kinase [Dolichospermum sp. ST_sed10]MDD1443841.1 glycerate kinase [Dolichospermum sp. ST_sed3]MDD1447535.1 glycerate kinase [Dolichospermum sp. ST_sed8]MDD1458211.1 glycerate kinase [Dolichospermum sp. ST_sed7]MDD1463365.1 glycerate kinase [Dolichospe
MSSEWLSKILTTDTSWQVLAEEAALVDPLRAKIFNITSDNVAEVIQRKRDLLKLVFPDFSQFCQTTLKTQPQGMLQILWDVWLPLAMKIAAQHQQLGKPFIQGILGAQGTGKTTMSMILSLILQHLGYRTLSLSLDDLYKTYSDRLDLMQQDSRLLWRGPPGTHDIHLATSLLDQIHQGNSPVIVPRFDKSAYGGMGDRTTPEVIMDDIDIVLFEGWFVGVKPIDPIAFLTAPPPILTNADRQFASDMNSQLTNYLPLWERLDSLIVLYPTDYRYSLAWRKQAERQMIATGKSGMSDAEIEKFVNYFWCSLHPELFINPLIQSSAVDLVIEIDADHSFGKIRKTISNY